MSSTSSNFGFGTAPAAAPQTSVHQSWQVPAAAVKEDNKLDWLRSCQQEGTAWLKSQRGYPDWRKAMDVISGRIAEGGSELRDYQSRLNTNHLKKNVREIVGVISDIRPMWGYQSDNGGYNSAAAMMNKVTRSIYQHQFFDRSIREAAQFAAVSCTGYLRPVYKRQLYGTGKGDIYLMSYGAPSVLPVQMPSNNDLQSAYSVTVQDDMPIAMAHGMFPLFQDKLSPSKAGYWYTTSGQVNNTNQNLFKRIWSKATGGGSDNGMSELTIPINYTYVIDLAINNTGRMIPMGEFGTSWYYEVPSRGQNIPAGTDSSGTPVFRKANDEDARLYPYRRLIVWADNVVLYDGPNWDWHGMVPLIPIRLDDWPWEGIGFSLVRDGYDQQAAINELMRGVMNKHATALDMPLGYDINAVTPREAKQFDAMAPRARIGFDGSQVDRPFVPVMPDSMLKVDEQTMAYIQLLKNDMDDQMALHEASALAALRSGSDDIEKILDSQGPIIKDMSRTMERSMRDLGEMMKYLVLQYYTSSRTMQIVGEDGMPNDTFDYDPSSLIPSHLKGESPDQDSPTPKIRRARLLAENLRFTITPNSMHELTQTSRKLLYLQLKRTGFPIDSRTVAEAIGIPNFGNKPEGATVFERWLNEQETGLILAARAKQLELSLETGGAIPPPGPMSPGAEAPQQTGSSGPNGGPSGTGGRAPTGQVMPHIVAKDGGARSTIAETK